MADRLYIDKRINETLIPKIDETHFLGLNVPDSDRLELFLFAMALGVKQGVRTPLGTKHGFILEPSIKSVDGAMSYLFSLLVDELKKINEEDKIDDKDYAFKVAEEYANTGFRIIDELMNKEMDEESQKYGLLEELDEEFESIRRDCV